MIHDPQNGATYWCLEPSMEAVEHGDTDVREPWLGKLVCDERGVLTLHSFNEATGEIDHDSNASALVRKEKLFATEAEAMIPYVNLLVLEIKNLHHQANKRLSMLSLAINRR